MNKQAIYHAPESEYAYALSDRALRIVLRTAAGEELEEVGLIYNNKYDFTERRFEAVMKKRFSDGTFDYYTADAELEDVRFAYIFYLKQKEKTYYFSEEGLSEDYDFPLAYYTFFQYPYINSDDVVRQVPWTEDAVFYQIFVDRFRRGDFSKDDGYVTQKWEEIPRAKSFAGGDLKGITASLGYLLSLGVNALYLTPVFRSDSNHKYNVGSYFEVDPQFGSDRDFRELIDGAHERGMKVVIDTVFNHCDRSHEYFRDVCEKGRASEYHDWFFIRGDKPDYEKGNYERFADCRYMPKWNTNNPQVREYLIGIALRLVEFYGIDGLRLDVADEVSHGFWRELRKRVKAAKPSALLIGEVWHENHHCLRGDEFDGVMNYKLQKILADCFGSGKLSAKEAAGRLNGLWLKNFEQVNRMMLNFLDNHDTPRFLRFAGGDKDRVLSALCAVFVFPGMPCVYYGTELPLDGGGDPDCRRTFDWSFRTQDKRFSDAFRRILALRREPVLKSGDFSARSDGDMLILSREKGKERINAYFNCGKDACSLAAQGKILYRQSYDGTALSSGGALVVKENV